VKKNIKGTMIGLAMILLVLGYYAYLSNRQTPTQNEAVKITRTQDVLLKDLTRNYPPSPKEVLKYYSEMTMCFYNEEHSEEEIKELALKARELYDSELLKNQTEEQYIRMLGEDISEYKNEKITVSSYSVSNSTDVEYYTRDNAEWAKLYCIYTLRKGTSLASTEEEFLLKKDEDGHWKIYGWILSPEKEESKEQKE